MTTQQIADRLVELCRTGDFETAQLELFTDDAVSIEPHETPNFAKETKGRQGFKEKGEKWNSLVEATHEIEVSDPIVAENAFACTMRFRITMKEHGEMNMQELCVYQLKDGKIISEQFFM